MFMLHKCSACQCLANVCIHFFYFPHLFQLQSVDVVAVNLPDRQLQNVSNVVENGVCVLEKTKMQ
jgi:hypothetical protein